MSKGVLTVIDSNVGPQQAFLTGTKILKQSLARAENRNRKAGLTGVDARPDLYDIARTHNLFVRGVVRPNVASAYEYFKSAKDGGDVVTLTDSESTVVFSLLENNGDFVHDMVLNMRMAELGRPGASVRYRYCDYPGLRMIRKIRLMIDGNAIDEYTTEDMLFNMKRLIGADDRQGFEMMVGQEAERTGEYYMSDLNINQVLRFKDGPQTFKPYQPELDLWVPLFFDFNRAIERSLHNSLLRTQQIALEVTFAPVNEIVQAEDGLGNLLPNKVAAHRMTKQSLYSKNIFLSAQVNDLFVNKTNMAIIRVNRHNNKVIVTGDNNILLSGLKYPIEYIQFGLRPQTNTNFNGANSRNSFQDWHKFATVERTEAPVPAIVNNPLTTPVQALVVRTATFTTERALINTVGFTIHGNELYSDFGEAFFNRYQPFVMPGVTSNATEGMYFLSFCHDPRGQELSGHMDNSVAREFRMRFTSSVTSAFRANLYVSARCINFLFYSNNSVKLKYIV